MQPRTSRSITDLLWAPLSIHYRSCIIPSTIKHAPPRRRRSLDDHESHACSLSTHCRYTEPNSEPPERNPRKSRCSNSMHVFSRRLNVAGGRSKWQRSRSLTQLSRQITSPTRSGHAPPFAESCKSFQSGNPAHVVAW